MRRAFTLQMHDRIEPLVFEDPFERYHQDIKTVYGSGGRVFGHTKGRADSDEA